MFNVQSDRTHIIIYIYNNLSQIIDLWDGIPFDFKALVLPWIEHCHGNIIMSYL